MELGAHCGEGEGVRKGHFASLLLGVSWWAGQGLLPLCPRALARLQFPPVLASARLPPPAGSLGPGGAWARREALKAVSGMEHGCGFPTGRLLSGDTATRPHPLPVSPGLPQ